MWRLERQLDRIAGRSLDRVAVTGDCSIDDEPVQAESA
jgi:hypothetical protein